MADFKERPGRAIKVDLIEDLRHQLKEISDRAGKLYETLGKEGERPRGRDREVILMAVDSRIKGIMQEATYFALNDMTEDFRRGMEAAMNWMEMKSDI